MTHWLQTQSLTTKVVFTTLSATTINALLFFALTGVNATTTVDPGYHSRIRLIVPPKPDSNRFKDSALKLTKPPPTPQVMTVDLDLDYPPHQSSLNIPDLSMPAIRIDQFQVGVPRVQPVRMDRIDRPPHELTGRQPLYPKIARRRGIEGSVTVKLLIDKTGRVTQITVLETIGHESFEQAVLDAAYQWRFEPARQAGLVVEVWGVKTVSFKLLDTP